MIYGVRIVQYMMVHQLEDGGINNACVYDLTSFISIMLQLPTSTISGSLSPS